MVSVHADARECLEVTTIGSRRQKRVKAAVPRGKRLRHVLCDRVRFTMAITNFELLGGAGNAHEGSAAVAE